MYRESGKMFDPNSKKEASSKPQNALTDYRAKGTVTLNFTKGTHACKTLRNRSVINLQPLKCIEFLLTSQP